MEKNVYKTQEKHIGDLLNMPFLGGWWNGSPHNNDNDLQRMNMIGTVYTGSILHYYIQDRPHNETIPNIPRLIKSVEMYEEKHKNSFLTIYNEVQEKNILCVHLRSGDKEVLLSKNSFVHICYSCGMTQLLNHLMKCIRNKKFNILII